MKYIKFALFLSASITAYAAPRTWTAADGRKIEAEAISKSETEVIVRRSSDNLIVALPLKLLSVEDQKYVKENSIPYEKKEAKVEGSAPPASTPTGKAPAGASGKSTRGAVEPNSPLGAWAGMKERLNAGDIDGAASHISEKNRAAYKQLFKDMEAKDASAKSDPNKPPK